MEKINLLFWLYKSKINASGTAPIYFRASSKTGKFQFSTGVYVDLKDWSSRQQKVRGSSARAQLANNTLKQLREKVEVALSEILQKHEDYNLVNLQRKLAATADKTGNLLKLFQEHNNRILSLVGKTYAPATHGIYEITRKEIQEFLVLKLGINDIPLSSLKLEFIEDLEVFYRLNKGNQTNTIIKKFQRLNKVINIGIKRGIISVNPLLTHRIKKEKKEIIFLTTDELKRMEKLRTGIPRLEVVRKLFLLTCYTGLAYRELYNLSEDSFEKGIDGNTWIRIYRQKTKKWVRVPLLPQASKIIQDLTESTVKVLPINKTTIKVGRNLTELSQKPIRLLKVPSNQKLNAYLKELGDLAKIKKELHSHVGRKTFSITIMLGAGVSLETVSKLLGHSSYKVTEEAYSQITDEKILSELWHYLKP